jgi:hypothetical protein
MWSLYGYQIGLAAVVAVLLLAGVIALCSREYQRPGEDVKAQSLSEEERVSLRNLRDVNLRETAQAKVFAQDPGEVTAEFLAGKARKRLTKKAAKAARKLVVRQVAGDSLPDKG